MVLSELEELLKHAFGAVELERQEMGPQSFHIEVRIADSVVVLETGEPLPDGATRGSIYVYARMSMRRVSARSSVVRQPWRSRQTSPTTNGLRECRIPSATPGGFQRSKRR